MGNDEIALWSIFPGGAGEERERGEMEEFHPIACLKYKLEANTDYMNKCGEKYET